MGCRLSDGKLELLGDLYFIEVNAKALREAVVSNNLKNNPEMRKHLKELIRLTNKAILRLQMILN